MNLGRALESHLVGKFSTGADRIPKMAQSVETKGAGGSRSSNGPSTIENPNQPITQQMRKAQCVTYRPVVRKGWFPSSSSCQMVAGGPAQYLLFLDSPSRHTLFRFRCHRIPVICDRTSAQAHRWRCFVVTALDFFVAERAGGDLNRRDHEVARQLDACINSNV